MPDPAANSMPRVFRYAIVCLWAASVSVLPACFSAKLQSVHQRPEFQARQIRHALVVCVTPRLSLRTEMEVEFVRQWTTRGVTAEAASTIFPDGASLDKADIDSEAKAKGFDSVFIVQLFTHFKEEPTDGQETTIVQDVKDVLASPENSPDALPTAVRASLYETGTQKRLWSAVFRAPLSEEAPWRTRDCASLILKTLYRSSGRS